MILTPRLNNTHKVALLMLVILLGTAPFNFAVGRDSSYMRQDSDASAETNTTQNADEDTDQKKLGDVSIEDRTRLRRDLDNYSRSLDPSRSQIEGNRILMRKRLQERFFMADKDNDGSLSRIEAAEMMPQIARHFSQVDLNGDELITMDELAVAQTKAIERQRLEEAQLEEREKADQKRAELSSNQEKSKNKQTDTSRKRAL